MRESETPVRDVPAWVRDAAAATGLEPLWQELARRLGEGGRRTRTVTLRGLTDEQRRAVAELLRTPTLPAAQVTVTLDKLTATLGISAEQLHAVVEERCGPIGDRAAARDSARQARAAASDRLTEAARRVAAAHPWIHHDQLARWAASQARAVGGDLHARETQVLAVLDVLVASAAAALPLAVAAAQAFADPHALDGDEPAGRLLDAALAAAADSGWTDATRRRDLRRRAGLLDDDVSSTVLGWKVPWEDTHPFAPMSRLLTEAQQPAVWTLGQLRQFAPQLRPSPVVVVENPAVIATAAARDVDVPVVCTSGVPSVAALLLLDAAARDGCDLLVHADFDPAGLRIVGSLLDRYPTARPWRMDAATYRRLAPAASVLLAADEEVPACFDAELEAAMRQLRVKVFEEQMVDELTRL